MQKQLNLVPYKYGYGNPYTMSRDEKRFYRRKMINEKMRYIHSLANLKNQIRIDELITLGKSLKIY